MKLRTFLRRIPQSARSFFGEEGLTLFPFTGPLRRYDRTKLRTDARSGLNVAILAVPQGMAYAAIAELPIVYGIICSAFAAIVAPIFSGSRHTILGPTNATAFMVFSFFAANPELAGRKHELVPLLVLIVGVLSVIGALMRVADLLQYVSRSVLVGYISGAATLIIANQGKHILGVADFLSAGSSRSFVGIVSSLWDALPHFAPLPLGIAVLTAMMYAAMNRWKPRWPNFALTLVVVSALAALAERFATPRIPSLADAFARLEHFSNFGFRDLAPHLPPLARSGIFDDIATLIGVAFAVAFLASLENTVMSKTLANKTGDRPDVNQDMFSVGMANLATAVAGGMPASGSLTRSSLNFASGALTRFSSMFSGFYVLAAALLIAASGLPGVGMPLIDFVPKSCLAGLVVMLAASLFSVKNIRICLRSTHDDAAVLVATFLATLITPLHAAIFIGVALSITLFLRKASQPHLVEYEFTDKGELREMGEKRRRPEPAISIVHVEGDLFFGAAELFRTQMQRIVADPSIRVIILRLKNARHLDATSVLALEDLIRFMRTQDRHIIVSGATREVYKVLKHSGVLEEIQKGADRSKGESNIFMTAPSNPNLSTRDALKRAQQLLGTRKAEVRIFYDPNKDKSES
jgi:SulP family sulfate permease